MELKTLFISLFIINFFLGIYAYLVKKTQTTFPGLNFWIISNFCIALGYLLIFLRGQISNLFSIVLAQNLFILAGFIRIFGFNNFHGKPHQKWLVVSTYIIIPLSVFSFLYFTYQTDSILIRTLLICFLLSIISAVTGILVFKNNSSESKHLYNLIATTFFLFSAILIIRIFAWIFLPSVRGLFVSNIFNYIQFFSSMVIDMSWTILFFVLHNQKLNSQLKDSEAMFRGIFEHNSSALALLDFDTKISMVNDEYCRMSGYTKDEVTGLSWTEQITSEDLPRLLEYNKKRLNDPLNAPDKYEFSFLHKNGHKIYALMSVALIPGLKKIIASFTNISERKQAELKLQEMADELKILNANKNLFISIIAHDLRNPFSVLINLSEISLYHIQNSNLKEAEKLVSSVNTVSKNAYHLLENLLVWSQSQEGRLPYYPEEYSADQLISEAINNIKESASTKQIEITYNFVSVNIYADLSMIKTVIRNLITNAVKYTNTGGRIDLLVEPGQEFDTIIVKDNGIGIKDESIKKIWSIAEKLTTRGTANETGSGLGLILCKEFIERHGGKIWVESDYGIGSTFKFTLPKKN